VYATALVCQRLRYVDGKFTCIQFTEEARIYFGLAGIKTYKCIGIDKNNNSRSHEWLGINLLGFVIPYEPQDFLPFNPNSEYKNITVSEW